ncbi:Inactive ubiquitin carboxyl-terminal hydrolase 54 (Inactive ubiquitin-specific peptidase 54), partial [Durusdinium trenchii]
ETIEAILGILHAANVEPLLIPRGIDQGSGKGGSGRLESAELVEEASDFGCHPLCLAHEVFGLEYVDFARCSFCGATGEPSAAASYVYNAYVTELERPSDPSTGSLLDMLRAPRRPFSEVLRQLCQTEEGKNCCECNSRKTMKTERWLTRRPKTFILSLVWPSSSPSRDLLWLILSMIQPTLRMEEIFQIASSNSCASSTTEASPASASAERSAERSTSLYSFHGMICYCGMHYVAVFWCPARRRWIFFDDTCVKEKADWSAVANLMMTGQYVPTLIFYESVSEEPALSESVEELTRQVEALESQQSCVAM